MGKRQTIPSSDEEQAAAVPVFRPRGSGGGNRRRALTDSDEEIKEPVKEKRKKCEKEEEGEGEAKDKEKRKAADENERKHGKDDRKGGEEKKSRDEKKRSEAKDEKKAGKKFRSEKQGKDDEKTADKKEKREKKDKDKDKVKDDQGKTPAELFAEEAQAKKAKKSKAPPTCNITFPAGREAFKDSRRPYGIEFDGLLVVDIADKAEVAKELNIQIGWQIASINGKKVHEENENRAAAMLREAEMRASKSSAGNPGVVVCFITEEPEHWRKASAKIKQRL